MRSIEQGTAEVHRFIRYRNNQKLLNDLFRLCDPIEERVDNSFDIRNLFYNLAVNFVRENNDKEVVVCRIMIDETLGSPIERLAENNNLILEKSNITCLDYDYNKMVDESKNVSWSSKQAGGQ